MKAPSRLLLLLLPMLVAGCASVPQLPGCVKLGPYGQICPLPPAELPAVAARHIVKLTRDGKAHTFLGHLRIDDNALRLVGSSLFGTDLFTITYDAHEVTSRPRNADLHAELIVAMLEVALAEPERLRPRLHGLVLKASGDGRTQVRKLYEHGRLAARIEQTGAPLRDARLTISIPPANLTLQLTPLDETP
jgi:hypothetical protein